MQTEVDKFLVLVAVADQTGLAALQLRHGRDELGLGPHFQPVVIGGAVLGYLFHHLLLLVDLDREHAPVGPLVPQFADGGAEGLVQQRNLRIENVFDTQQNRHVVAAFLDFVDDFQHADFRTSFAPEGPDDDLAPGRHVKIPGSPVADAVKLGGVFHAPLLQGSFFGQCSGSFMREKEEGRGFDALAGDDVKSLTP